MFGGLCTSCPRDDLSIMLKDSRIFSRGPSTMSKLGSTLSSLIALLLVAVFPRRLLVLFPGIFLFISSIISKISSTSSYENFPSEVITPCTNLGSPTTSPLQFSWIIKDKVGLGTLGSREQRSLENWRGSIGKFSAPMPTQVMVHICNVNSNFKGIRFLFESHMDGVIQISGCGRINCKDSILLWVKNLAILLLPFNRGFRHFQLLFTEFPEHMLVQSQSKRVQQTRRENIEVVTRAIDLY
ncbi:hypothetical protein HWI79_22 [Cryptosporidium felis]|nr:hypothetical protein HWI79_22 [Cryptosporidium felis]